MICTRIVVVAVVIVGAAFSVPINDGAERQSLYNGHGEHQNYIRHEEWKCGIIFSLKNRKKDDLRVGVRDREEEERAERRGREDCVRMCILRAEQREGLQKDSTLLGTLRTALCR